MKISLQNNMPKIIFSLTFVFVCILVPHGVTHASLTDGLVGHWTFDGKDTTWTSATTGTTRDLSGNGNTGTLTNMNRATAPTLGKLGQGFEFNGTTTIINVGANPSLINSYTFSVWTKRASTTNDETVISNYNGYGGDSTRIRLSQYFTQFYYLGTSIDSPAILDKKWHHIVCYRNSNTGQVGIYIDGVLSTSTVRTTGVASYGLNGLLAIGGNNIISGGSGQRVFSGSLDDARIYNRTLSASEVTLLYKQGATKLGVTPSRNITSASTTCTGISCGLVGHWTFDGKDTTWTSATAGTVRDVSGNGNTGTMVNMNRATAPKTGKIGQGLNLNGTTQDIILASSPVGNNDTTVTVSAWIKPSTISGEHAIFAPHVDQSWYVGQFGSSLAWRRGGVSSGITNSLWSQSNVVINNKWQFVTFVGTPTSLSIYSNGSLVVSTSTDGMIAGTTANPIIGSTGSRDFQGSLDDVRIYNRALSASEINQLYKTGATKLGVTPSRANATSTGTVGLGAGLVGHWTFDGKDTTWTSSTAGTVRDVSGNGNTGTFTNMNRATAPKTGKIGQGVNFDNASLQYVDLNNPASPGLSSTSTMTVSTWVKTGSSIINSHCGIVKRGSEFGLITTDQYFLGSSNDRWKFSMGNGTTSASAESSGNSLKVNTWYHLMGIVDENNLYLYVNGVLRATQTRLGGAVPSSAMMLIGSWARSIGHWNGLIDDVRIYNRALSATEIQKLYKLGQTRMR